MQSTPATHPIFAGQRLVSTGGEDYKVIGYGTFEALTFEALPMSLSGESG